MPNTAAPFPGLYQVAYVTNDFERALAQFAATHGIREFTQMKQMHYNTGPGREAICNIALAYVGATEIEIIEPLDGDVQLYRDYLPNDGRFGVRMHHLCHLYATRAELEQQVAAFRQQGRALPIDGATPGAARYFYVDFRAEFGHYLEGIYFEPEAQAFLASIPRF